MFTTDFYKRYKFLQYKQMKTQILLLFIEYNFDYRKTETFQGPMMI